MGVSVVAGACLADRRSAKAKVARPGIQPAGRRVILPNVVVMGFDDDGRVAYEHIYWDQASLLVQIGLLDPKTLPVSGAEQARRLLNPHELANELIARSLLAKQRAPLAQPTAPLRLLDPDGREVRSAGVARAPVWRRIFGSALSVIAGRTCCSSRYLPD